VIVTLNDEWGNSMQQRLLLHTTATNNKPMLMLSDSIVCEGNIFRAYLTSTDGDMAFGDTNHYTILQKPTWLNFRTRNDTVYFVGIPEGDTMNGLIYQDSLLRILAVDTKNDSTMVEYLIRITPRLQILSAVRDTAIEDQRYAYPLVVNRNEEELQNVSFSLVNFPKWLYPDKSNQLSGTPNIANLGDTLLRFAAYDKNCKMYVEQEAIISILPSPPTKISHVSGNCSIQIIKSQENLYYAEVQTKRNINFQYQIYSVGGTLLFSSSVQHLTENSNLIPFNMNQYSNGIYIFVGVENNKYRYPIKFLKN
jgi:hypothetical protein